MTATSQAPDAPKASTPANHEQAFERHFTPALLVLFGLAFALYFGVVAAGFVWDDAQLIRGDARIRSLGNLPQIWVSSLFPESVESVRYYRPLVSSSFAVDWSLWGDNPAGYHAHSLAWFLASIASFTLMMRRLAGAQAALLAGAIYAVCPPQAELVAWISGRGDLMAITFGCAAVGTLLSATTTKQRATAAVLVWLSLCSKEQGLFFAIAALGAVAMAQGREAATRTLPWLFLAISAWAPLYAQASGTSAVASTLASVAAAAIPLVLARWFEVLLVPWAPVAGLMVRDLSWGIGTGGTLLFAVFAGLAVVVSRSKGAILGIALACLSVLPTLLIVFGTGLVADRYVVIPLTFGLWSVASWTPSFRLLIATVWLPIAAVTMSQRLPNWASNVALFTDAVERIDTPYVRMQLGIALNEQRDPEALPLLLSALESTPAECGATTGAIAATLSFSPPASRESYLTRIDASGCETPDEALHGRALLAALCGRESEVRALRDRAAATQASATTLAANFGPVDGYLAGVETGEAGIRTWLSTQPDPAASARTLARIFRDGGHADLADMTLMIP